MEENKLLKRQRDENEEEYYEEEEEALKRQKSFKDIMTLLDEEEDDPNEDLSSLISTLQEEISSGPESGPARSGPDEQDSENPSSSAGSSEEEEGERVMRHLLEASDDELGLPSTDGSATVEKGHVDGGDFLFTFGGLVKGFGSLKTMRLLTTTICCSLRFTCSLAPEFAKMPFCFNLGGFRGQEKK